MKTRFGEGKKGCSSGISLGFKILVGAEGIGKLIGESSRQRLDIQD